MTWWSILDPFCGSGAIPLAADRIQRHGIEIKISKGYVAVVRRRIEGDVPLFAERAAE